MPPPVSTTRNTAAETLFVVGRFPPPIDGQAMATQRLAELLGPVRNVQAVDLSPPSTNLVEAEVRLRPGKIRHYADLREQVRSTLQTAPEAPVLWTAVSPAPLGHVRDLLIMLPAFRQHPVYAVIHWGDFERLFLSPITSFTAPRLVRRLRGFVFLSETLAKRCAPWIPERRRFAIPNTVDEALRYSNVDLVAKQALRRGRSRLHLLFLSNMIPSKGYLDVLHAVRLLHARGVPVHACFAGGWTSEADRVGFERVVAEHGLQEVVTHHGAVDDRARVKALYKDADVFILPTYYPTEAQPLSIIEALSAATPIITTEHAGLPEMVREDREALFVPPRNPEAIAGAVEQLRDLARWERLSDAALRRFHERFSPAAVRAQWEALLTAEDEF